MGKRKHRTRKQIQLQKGLLGTIEVPNRIFVCLCIGLLKRGFLFSVLFKALTPVSSLHNFQLE